jgi:putative ABC transport system substrate-binding protein
MRRREFITVLGTVLGASFGGMAAGWPLAANAQHVAKNWKIGVLHPGQAAAVDARITAIREGLNRPDSQASGLELVVRLADGNLSRLPALATELVNDRVDVIVAAGPPAVQAASGATATTPVIAIDLESDPVAIGFIASLARPGRNITGVFLDFPDFSAKCLQLLIESVPALSGVGVLWDPTTGSQQLDEVKRAAQGLSVRVEVFEARRVADVADAFYALDAARIQGVVVLSSPLFGGNPQMVADLAIKRNVPTISLFPDIAREGGLLAYGPDIQGLYRQAGAMARKVLDGAKPAETPAERPTRFQLVANLRTAKRLGITLPTSILLRADETIE